MKWREFGGARFFGSVVLAALVCGGVVVLAAKFPGGTPQEAASVVRASKFELVDPDGRVVADIAYRDGGPEIVLYDGDGKRRVILTQSPEQGGLFVLDSNEGTRLGAALFSHGGAGYALHGPELKGAAVLYYKESGSLSFYQPDGTVELRLPPVRGQQ